jgi:hypothetical protein
MDPIIGLIVISLTLLFFILGTAPLMSEPPDSADQSESDCNECPSI